MNDSVSCIIETLKGTDFLFHISTKSMHIHNTDNPSTIRSLYCITDR